MEPNNQFDKNTTSTTTTESQTDAVGTPQSQVSDTNTGNEYDQSEGDREQTRSRMAILFIIGFFSVIFLCFIYSTVTNSGIKELRDLLTSIIGALSGILGFIIGFYYKSSIEK